MLARAGRGTTLTDLAQRARDKAPGLIVLAGILIAAAVFLRGGPLELASTAAAASVTGLLLLFSVFWLHPGKTKTKDTDTLSTFIAEDVVASFVVNGNGEIQFSNKSARRRCGDRIGETLAATLKSTFANPAPLLQRLQEVVLTAGAAREDVVTRKGQVRLSVHRVGDDRFMWRIEDLQEASGVGRFVAPALPMLMLGRGETVLSMNEEARNLIGIRVKSLDRVFKKLPLVSGQVAEIDTGELRTMVTPWEVEASAGRRTLYLLPTDVPDTADGWQSIEELPVPLLRVSPNGDVLAFNDSARAMLGAELRNGALMSDLMEGLGRSIRDWLHETIDGRVGQNTEFLRLRRIDKEVFVQVTLKPVESAEGPELIAVLNDATELKTLEAQFVQSQKMQAIGQLAGGVAHDFNNLLTAISGHCDLLLLRHDQGDPDYADLVQINQNANRAAALVSQLLAFSRKQTLRPKTIDMRDTLADLTHLLNRLVGERVSLQTSYDPVLPPIRADKRQLEQVLMNLVVNARDAMPEGGEIRVVCEFADLSKPLVRDNATVPAGPYVCVTVTDQGTGIPSDKLQKVFEPFYTTKRTDEGTGLGLSTAYGIVKQTGGFIFVDSVIGKGTTFTLFLPAQEQREDFVELPVKEEVAKPAAVHGHGVILLVEDEAPVRAFASRALRMRGYTVLEADSAEAALETLSDTSLNVDVFVTDVVMPGMDGPSWVKKALKARPDTRVVFVSGYAEDSFDEMQARIPNSVFLPKPFSLTDLAETVHRQLH